jgi:hypothetical protein
LDLPLLSFQPQVNVKDSPVMFKKSWQLALATIGLFLVVGTSAAQAVTLSIGDKALNTNLKFRPVYGYPRLSIWDLNPRDNDQNFGYEDRGNGTAIKHTSTGMCLNAPKTESGIEINVSPCDPNNPDRNHKWSVTYLPNSGPRSNPTVTIKKYGTNLCVQALNLVNGGIVQLNTCNNTNPNPNQVWKVQGNILF